MAVVLDPSLADVCRRLNEHRRYSAWLRVRCAAGCGRWPCDPFLRALEEMLRSSWLSQQTGLPGTGRGWRTAGVGPLGLAAGQSAGQSAGWSGEGGAADGA